MTDPEEYDRLRQEEIHQEAREAEEASFDNWVDEMSDKDLVDQIGRDNLLGVIEPTDLLNAAGGRDSVVDNWKSELRDIWSEGR